MDCTRTLPLLLLLLIRAHADLGSVPQPPCPYRCMCYSAGQLLCADERMSSLPANVSKQVREVVVMTSGVAYLFPRILQESPQLNKLVFLNNVLRSVHSRAFEVLTELSELEISGNPYLDNLILGTFSNQTNLTTLLLNFNRFKMMELGMFDSLKRLETLHLKGNILSYLPHFLFRNLRRLRLLDLSRNKLEDVQRDTFAGLDVLEILNINNNLIANLTVDIFHNVSALRELHLEGNKISELPDGIFSALTHLSVINLRGNLLTTFSDRLFGFNTKHLAELNLKGNRLTQVSTFSSFTFLTDLTLSSNQLSNLTEDTFGNLTLLENLDLSENQLTFLPEGIFHDLMALKALHLQMNNLTKLDPKLFRDQGLIQQVYLSHNQLETLPPGFFDPLLLQYKLRLHGNPWRCDCRMQYMHDWVQKNSQDVDMLDSVLCHQPVFLRGRPVVSVDAMQLLCPLSRDQTPDPSRCSVQTSNGTVVVSCEVDRCSPVIVKVQFQEEGVSVKEHALEHRPEHPQCGNDTRLEEPVH